MDAETYRNTKMHLSTWRIAEPFETIVEHFEKDNLNTLRHNNLPSSLLQEFIVLTVALFVNIQVVLTQSQTLYSIAGMHMRFIYLYLQG